MPWTPRVGSACVAVATLPDPTQSPTLSLPPLCVLSQPKKRRPLASFRSWQLHHRRPHVKYSGLAPRGRDGPGPLPMQNLFRGEQIKLGGTTPRRPGREGTGRVGGRGRSRARRRDTPTEQRP